MNERPRIGTDCGHQADIDGQSRYYETLPSRTVQLIVQHFEAHRALKQRLGATYYVIIADICCNPFRSKQL